ncbi:MAG: tetratricopeptide repeat protein [Rikenellaceae bacterium]|nr:tetratricopeptide repeat protein [Rikenellaceae bacterium]
MKRLLMIYALLLLSWAACAQSDSLAVESSLPAPEPMPASVEAMWDAANTAYINNDYARAEEVYMAIEAQGERSAKLYYNLANACFKQEELGRAILYYHRALLLSPGDEDTRYNLSVAEARTKDTIDVIPEFFLTTWMRALRHAMSSNLWCGVSLVLLVAMLALVLFYLLAHRLSLRKVGFYGTLCALLLFVVATWFAAANRAEQLSEERAVVMSLSAAVKSSPDRAATDLFVLHEGTVVEVTNRLAEWCEVTIADGKKGWTESSKLEVI